MVARKWLLKFASNTTDYSVLYLSYLQIQCNNFQTIMTSCLIRVKKSGFGGVSVINLITRSEQ